MKNILSAAIIAVSFAGACQANAQDRQFVCQLFVYEPECQAEGNQNRRVECSEPATSPNLPNATTASKYIAGFLNAGYKLANEVSSQARNGCADEQATQVYTFIK